MADPKVLESLFNEAKRLFGSSSKITSSVQNPGCLKTQADVEEVMLEIRNQLGNNKEKYIRWVKDVGDLSENIHKAFIKGQL